MRHNLIFKFFIIYVLSARAERTKDTLKGIPLRIPQKVRKSSQQPHRFFAKARRCERFAEVASAKRSLRKV